MEKNIGPVNSIVLSRSGEADNVYLQDETSIQENGLCEIKIIDNQIMNDNNRSDYLPDLLATLGGLEYYLNDFSSTGICYYDICDRYNIQIGENTYSCIMLNDEINVTDGLEELIYTERLEESETDYTKADKTDRKINQTYLLVDKQNQVIQSVVTNVTEQNNKISSLTQSVDELSSKIQDIADITIAGETSYATLQLDNVNESEPISVIIHPISENISYLYPRANGLYPDDLLYMPNRILRFTNLTENTYVDYELPDDLLYYDSEHYDEFYLNYDSGTCQVTKRCKYNADGTVSLLDNEIVNSYNYPLIQLTDGDYEISLLGYEYGYLSVRLMASNIYTSQFATKVEMNSAITQKANEISLVVNEKLDEEDFTHASIVAKINDDTSQVQIEADKVDISANDVINILAGNTINMKAKQIGFTSDNWSVTPNGNLTARNANITGTINSNNATITGGKITLESDYSYGNTPAIEINSTHSNITTKIFNSRIALTNNGASPMLLLELFNGQSLLTLIGQDGTATFIDNTSVTSPRIIQTSLHSDKKNFEKMTDNALEIIKNIDIYKYNLKFEKDTDKKHLGFVIGDKFNYSKEVTNNDNTGVDDYSFISLCCKAIQEQQQQIKEQQQQIKELKKEINKLKGEK